VAETAGQALYRAWRPQTFEDVVGQHHCVQTLRNAIKNGTLAHAYLFAGPRGTGKTTMARLLFKAANCLDPRDGAPCERCAICVSANEGRALDLIEMDAASNRGIDDVRDLRDKIHYAPGEARYRVYILDEAHQLTQAAWDALLKTLEEPPPHAILVLATTEAHKVPATVLSRCQRFDFHRHSAADIRDRLARIAEHEGILVAPTVLSWLARAARGGMRDAISLLDQLRAFAGDRIDVQSARDVLGLAGLETVRPFLEALQEDRAGDALEELNAAVERGTDLRVYVGDALAYLRALMLLRYGASATLQSEFPSEELEWLERRVSEWEAGRLRGLVGGFGDALARFRDPAQLLVQVELVLLAQWDAPEAPAPRRVAESRRPVPSVTVREDDKLGATAKAPVSSSPPDRVDGESRPPVGRPEAPSVETPGAVAVTLAEDPNGTVLVSDAVDVEAPVEEPSAPSPAATAAATHPPLDLAAVRECWSQIQNRLGSNPSLAWFHTCELEGVDVDTLVLGLGGGVRIYLDGRERRLLVEKALGEALGRPVRVRVAGDADRPATPEDSADQAAPRPPTDDPVVQAGLRLFGGPLQPVPEE
jgi:DNA polymerase-3 subunit gamma/tau